MELPNPRLSDLFEQLGLKSEDHAIEAFIAEHRLPDEVKLIDAKFWTSSQRELLKEKLRSDDNWAPIVDELNERLHDQPSH